MKILLTGATGKVGSRLTKRLAQRGDQVRALVRDEARAAGLRDDRIELVEGDLLEADSLAAAVRGVDAVVHCAAFFRGATPEQAHAVNDLGTQNLASAARAASVRRFIFTSTGLVYGSNGGRLDAPSPAHRLYHVVDDESPDLATLFASVGALPPDGSNAENARAFDALLDGRRIREELGFKPLFPRLADALAAGA